MNCSNKYRYELLDLKNIRATTEYEAFVSSHQNGCFMQSLKWHGVKQSWKVQAVVVRDNTNEICASMLILIKTLPILSVSLFYSPRGPVCDLNNYTLMTCLFDGAFELSKKYNACSFKLDPFINENDDSFITFLRGRGFLFQPGAANNETAQTRANYILNISGKSEEELIFSFKPKWRYNIRLAQRKGVDCAVRGKECLDDFLSLMHETGKRDGFAVRPKEYFERMMQSLGDDCRLYMCYKAGVPLSGAVCVRYGVRTCYVYGASTSQYRNLMPNYLMQWEMIKWALESGCKIYDFMGIPHYDNPAHSNYGVYRFKQGFNGQIAVYAGEFEYVYSKEGKHLWDICSRVFSTVMRLEHFLKTGVFLPKDQPHVQQSPACAPAREKRA